MLLLRHHPSPGKALTLVVGTRSPPDASCVVLFFDSCFAVDDDADDDGKYGVCMSMLMNSTLLLVRLRVPVPSTRLPENVCECLNGEREREETRGEGEGGKRRDEKNEVPSSVKMLTQTEMHEHSRSCTRAAAKDA